MSAIASTRMDYDVSKVILLVNYISFVSSYSKSRPAYCLQPKLYHKNRSCVGLSDPCRKRMSNYALTETEVTSWDFVDWSTKPT